jgi:hypothetical protein
MEACWCTLGNTERCKHCPSNYGYYENSFPYEVKTDYTDFLHKQIESTKEGIDPKIIKLSNINFLGVS